MKSGVSMLVDNSLQLAHHISHLREMLGKLTGANHVSIKTDNLDLYGLSASLTVTIQSVGFTGMSFRERFDSLWEHIEDEAPHFLYRYSFAFIPLTPQEFEQ